MSELNDVTGGETIAEAFTNQVKERTIMRYASVAARDTSIPAPIEGSMAYLQDSDTVTYYNGTGWVDMGLLIDASNGPITGNFETLGNLVSSKEGGAALVLRASDQATGWNVIANVSTGVDGPLTFGVAGDATAVEFTEDGQVQLQLPVTSGVRNVHASTGTPVGGIDGDLWLQYTP